MTLRRTILCTLLASTALALPVHAANSTTKTTTTDTTVVSSTTKAPAKSVVYKNQEEAPVVVVTPLKAATDLSKVPMAVSVINADKIAQDQPQSIDDVLRDVPNYAPAGGPRSSTEEPSLRGLSDRRIVIKVDGIRRNFRAQYGGRYFIDPYMIDSAEVVRGSNSAVDGSGAMAGVMQFFTPSVNKQLAGTGRNWGTEEKVGYQSANHEFSTMLSGYGKTDTVDLYTALTYRDGGDFRAGKGQTIQDSSDMPKNGLVKAGFNFSPTHRMELRYSRYYDKSDVPASPFQPVDPAIGNFPSHRDTGVTDYSLNYNFSPENSLSNYINIKSVLYRSEYSISTTRDFDQRLDETDFTTNGIDTFNVAKLNYAGMRHNLTTGVEYFENKQDGTRNGVVRSSLGSGQDSNLGLYVQQESFLTDKLSIVPGVRYDHYTLEPASAANPSKSDDHWSPKLGVNYSITNALSAYGSVSSAFRTPTMTELYSTGLLFPGNTLISNPNLQPETGWNKEIGLRYKDTGVFSAYDSFNISGSVFQNDIHDYIEQIIGATTTQFRNDAHARLRGVEINGRYRINNIAALFNIGTVRGQNETLDVPLADVPQNRYSVGMEYYTFENRMTSGVRATHNAAQDRIAPGQSFIATSDGATTYDVYGSYTPQLPNNNTGAFRLDYGIDNVFDKNYRKQLSFLPESGRNAKVTATWKF